MQLLGDSHVQASIDFDEANQVSVALLESLEAQECEVGLGIAAAGLVLCRLMSPANMPPQAEAKFVADLMDWGGMYFATGGSN